MSAITVRTRHEFLRTSLLIFPIKALACFLFDFIEIFVPGIVRRGAEHEIL